MKKMKLTQKDYKRLSTRNFNVVGVNSFFTASEYMIKDNTLVL